MPRHKVVVHVMLKPGVLDPAGQAVADVLRQEGFPAESVRIGRRIEVELLAADVDEARAVARDMARAVLANPVLESFHIEGEPSA
jgi:phosphoribosylformylglycinamidine synthase PurS subunit